MREECQTLLEHNAEKLQLPDFPDFPAHFEVPPVLPIPRLLPSHEWIQGLGPLPSQHASAAASQHASAVESQRASADDEQTGFESSTMLLSAAGSALGFSSAMAVFFVLKRRRSAGGGGARGRVAVTSSSASVKMPQATVEMSS